MQGNGGELRKEYSGLGFKCKEDPRIVQRLMMVHCVASLISYVYLCLYESLVLK